VIPPPPKERLAIWTDQVWGASVPVNRKMFCNRSLNMKQIKVCVCGWGGGERGGAGGPLIKLLGSVAGRALAWFMRLRRFEACGVGVTL